MENITILIAFIGVCLSVLTYQAGVKKSSKNDGYNRGVFEGEIRSSIASLSKKLDELAKKLDKNDGNIDEAIKDHERRFHGAS